MWKKFVTQNKHRRFKQVAEKCSTSLQNRMHIIIMLPTTVYMIDILYFKLLAIAISLYYYSICRLLNLAKKTKIII